MGRKFAIAAQYIAIDLKNAVQAHLESLGHEVVDLICAEEQETISFTTAAQYMARAITSGEYELGFLFCGSGMGVSQVVNKYKGVRGALVESPLTAKLSRMINDSNVMCMGGNILTPTVAREMVDAFISSEFLGDEPDHTSVRAKRLMDGVALMSQIGEEI